jgi:hypothetical protein
VINLDIRSTVMNSNVVARRLARANRTSVTVVVDEQPMTVRRRPGRRTVEQAAIRASLLGVSQ